MTQPTARNDGWLGKTSPPNYSTAAKTAQPVNSEMLAELFEADAAPDIYPGPRRQRVHGWDAQFMTIGDRTADSIIEFRHYQRNNRWLLKDKYGIAVRYWQPIFCFTQLDLVVRWVDDEDVPDLQPTNH
jgi:hypothetical protein